MARRVSICVVNGPGVNNSGVRGMLTSLLGSANGDATAGKPSQTPAG
jgi:hypothetical protein